jgi:hypothetical protein
VIKMSALDTLRTALFGSPPSIAYEPSKDGVLRAFEEMLASISALTFGAVSVVKATRALLNADLAYNANVIALVYGDSTETNNDFYVKVGASGSGSWTLTSALHDAVGTAVQIDLNNSTLRVSPDQNVGLGIETFFSLTTGTGNVSFGYQAGKSGTSAANNTVIGRAALRANMAGAGNVVVGSGARVSQTGGNNNVVIGVDAMSGSSVASSSNVAIGKSALNAYGGDETVAIGFSALSSNTTSGLRNVAIGAYAGSAVTTGEYNVFLGYGAGAGLQPTGRVNIVGIGKNAIVPRDNMVVLGDTAMKEFGMFGTTMLKGKPSNYQYFFGPAGNLTTTGNGLIGIGENAMLGHVSGDLNVAIGLNAMINASTPANCVAVGAYAMQEADGLIDSVAFGNETLRVATSGIGLVAVGHWSLHSSTTGTGNTALGDSALHDLTDGNENVAVGYTTSHDNVSGDRNTEVGYAAGREKTSGNDNVNVGNRAGFKASSGNGNVNVGSNAGGGTPVNGIATGSNNTNIGFNAGDNASQKIDAVNSMALGAGTFTTKDNQVVIGNSSVTETMLRGVQRGTTFTVAALPSAATMGAGARAFVTDATATTFTSVVASGGANGMPVYSDGTNWRIG